MARSGYDRKGSLRFRREASWYAGVAGFRAVSGEPQDRKQNLMERPLEIHGGLLARNTVLNLMGYVVPLLVGLAAIPYVVRGLGSEGFGILSIVWVLLGYFSLFDLGLGRATTKFIAECLSRGEMARLPGLVWTSLAYQLVFGVAGRTCTKA